MNQRKQCFLHEPDFLDDVLHELNTYRQCKARENYILEEKAKGNLDLKISLVTSDTSYSAVHKLRYLRIGISDDWPNTHMAKYFGVNSIEGVKK